MNPITLASRMIARRRRLMLRSAIPLGFAAFAAVVIVAVVQSVGVNVLEIQRIEVSGELAARTRSVLPDLNRTSLRTAPSLLASHAWVTAAVVTTDRDSITAEVWFTDISQELAFRARATPGDEGPPEDAEGFPGGGGSAFAADGPLTVTIPNLQPISAPGGTFIDYLDRTILLLPWELFPEDGFSETVAGAEIVRQRGEQPVSRHELGRIASEYGLSPTGWRTLARDRLRGLWLLGGVITGLLFVAGGLATAPAIGILVRRFSNEFDLLWAMGYSRSYVRTLVVTVGGMISGIAASAGAVAAGIAVAVVSARGGLDPSVLPLYWLDINPSPGGIVPEPPVVAAIIVIGIAIVVGAAAALPAARLPATMGRHGKLWR